MNDQTNIAFSDNPNVTLDDVLKAAESQERIHPRDVSFIMDGLSVRQCRAFVQHEGFAPTGDLAWAIRIGLIQTDGKITDKGQAFRSEIV